MTNILQASRHGIPQISPLAQVEKRHGFLSMMLAKWNLPLIEKCISLDSYLSVTNEPLCRRFR